MGFCRSQGKSTRGHTPFKIMNSQTNEAERIKNVYRERNHSVPQFRYSYFNPSHLFTLQRREWATIALLRRYGYQDLRNLRILDIGCGKGEILRNFINYGAAPTNLFGIDLLSDRVKIARDSCPNINFSCRDSVDLGYEKNSFDIVTQFTVFTSVLDLGAKKKMASEMTRVLKFDGLLIWYDFLVNNPLNPDVRGIKKGEIKRLFPNCEIHLKRISLAAPLARTLVPFSPMLGYCLEKIPLLCTHYIGAIRAKR